MKLALPRQHRNARVPWCDATVAMTMAAETIASNDSEAIALFDAISSMLRTGTTLGEALSDMTAGDCEAMYGAGYNLYEQGRYGDAFKVFSLVVMQNHLEPRYLFGLGCSCQMLGRYLDALQHYMAAALACVNDPRPILHAAECLVAMSRIEEARESLGLVLDMSPDAQSPLNIRAQMLLQGLSEQHPLEGGNDEHL